jgi:peptide/nickel transport system ATP-binding protein
MADRIMVMKDGAIVESGPSYKIINEPTADYTKNLIDSIPS